MSPEQRLRSRPTNKIAEVRNFELDGFFFAPYTTRFKTDNSCVVCEYVESETQQKTLCYGRIRFVFRHVLFTKTTEVMKDGVRSTKVEEKAGVFADCDWYLQDQDNPVDELTGLKRIRRNPLFDSARLILVTHLLPVHLAFWPENPWDDDCDTYLVIHQRDRDPANFVH